MLSGVGIDIVKVSRIKNLALAHLGFVNRIFTKNEISFCRSKRYPYQHFAVRFAAKEAFLKALRTGWGTQQSPPFSDIEIISSNNNVPSVMLHNKTKKICKRLDVKRIHLSLSHTQDMAIAIVILEICKQL
ncbi:MAG: holo-ACP synthase [Planctomycetota bacterium]|nr:holo-ACP synthase [Planctomycetota bacterium]MDI6787005.1 holo-ACP synthase [Planctomycetota bacterium]